jgi:hypothetical protein
MDYAEAYQLILQQVCSPEGASQQNLVDRLRHQKPPIPGQITTLLLALKVLYEGLRGVTTLERSLVSALYSLVQESQHWYDQGLKAGVEWPPLLEVDLRQIAKSVHNILSDRWD